MKALTHIYIMNVVLDDARNGSVHIPPHGTFEVDPRFRKIIMDKTHDDYFRAGAIGPDGFPDLLTGQTEIHSQTDIWLDYLRTRAEAIRSSGDRDKALAFYGGFLSHASADMWAHDWTNYYAGGPWPAMTKLTSGDPDAWENITKHIAIEMSLEEKVEESNPNLEKSIAVPKEYLFDCMINTARVYYCRTVPGPLDLYFPPKMGILIDPLVMNYWKKRAYMNKNRRTSYTETGMKISGKVCGPGSKSMKRPGRKFYQAHRERGRLTV